MMAHRDCIFCYANVKCRGNYRGHRGYRAPRSTYQESVWSFMKKPARIEARAWMGTDVSDSRFRETYPDLCAFMADEAWDDGSLRETGTLFLFISGTAWKGMLKDRSLGRVAFVTGITLEGILTHLDEGLRDGSLDWRVEKARPQGRGR